MSTVSKISFGDSPSKNYNLLSERHRKRPLLNSISSMTDEEIVEASVRRANKDVSNTKAARVLKNGPIMFLAATIAGYGALTKGKLSNKISATAKMAGSALVVGALAKPVNTIVDGVMNLGNKNEEKRTDKHPIASSLVNIAALAATSLLALKGINKGANKLAQKFAPTANQLAETLKSGAKVINESYAGKVSDKFTKKVGEFASKHPKITKVAKETGFLLPIAGYVGMTSALSGKIINDRNKMAASNINKLLLCREYADCALADDIEIDE